MRKRALESDSDAKKSGQGKTWLKSIGSVLFAILATSHHWLHVLLISVGLTSIGAFLFNMSPLLKMILLIVSLLISVQFIFVAKRKWRHERSIAWVYAISSILSIVIVFSAIPQTIATFVQPSPDTQNQDSDNDSINTHDHNHGVTNR
ncbi:hypothetical protein ABNN70_00475 [Sporolactobacillus sp. Y61]|uniref:Uncharacterized protein n=1 Tax=Sporolactobacillus sp. Y61 TaxID=3160863 RepID=A0AAU8IF07_9BACL